MRRIGFGGGNWKANKSVPPWAIQVPVFRKNGAQGRVSCKCPETSAKMGAFQDGRLSFDGTLF